MSPEAKQILETAADGLAKLPRNASDLAVLTMLQSVIERDQRRGGAAAPVPAPQGLTNAPVKGSRRK